MNAEIKIPKRKFRIIGWIEPKRLDKMNVPELMMMRDRAYMLAFSYGGCKKVADYWYRIEAVCQALIDSWDNDKKLAEYESQKAAGALK